MFSSSLKSILFAFTISWTSLSFSSQDVLKPVNIIGKIHKEIAKQDIGGSITLVNAEILNGLTTALKYRIESEPSYMGGYYNRVDKYSLLLDLAPGDLIGNLDTPIGFNIRKGSDILFIRQFPSRKQSLTALPYTPANLPFTANKALTKLVPGDFVAFEANLSVIVNVGHSFLQGTLDAGVGTHAFVSGNFLVHVFRMPDDQVRVKLIAVRGKGAGVGGGVSVLDDDLEILGIRILDNRLVKWLNITPLRLDGALSKKDVFMVDYVFNLRDPEAAAAYEQMMLHKVQLKDVKISNPMASRTDLMNELLVNLDAVEDLALEDVSIPEYLRRVQRIFKGSTEVNTHERSVKLGLGIWKMQSGRAYAENKILSYDQYNNPEYFLLNTFSAHKKKKIFFGLFGDDTLMTSNLLFSSNPEWKAGRFVTLTSSHEFKMREVSWNDFDKIQRLTKETLGEKAYAEIDWTPWTNYTGRKVNAYYKQEIFFNPEALNILPQMSASDLASKFKSYVAIKGQPMSEPMLSESAIQPRFIKGWIARFRGDFKSIGKNLSVVVSNTKSLDERHDAFEELHQIPIWRERGMGFLLDFFTPAERDRVLRYQMTLSAVDAPTVEHSFGKFHEERLYYSLMFIQNIIHNRSYDMRLYSAPQSSDPMVEFYQP